MPRPKSVLITLFIVAAFTFCASCAEDQRETISKSIFKYPGPPISFNFSGDMYVAQKEDNYCKLRNIGSDEYFWFIFSSSPADGKTPQEALELLVKAEFGFFWKNEFSMKDVLVGDIEDVQRSINGQVLQGKLVRTRSPLFHTEFINELYAYQKGNRFIFLLFRTELKGRVEAESNFKIIADSLQWESGRPSNRPERLKYPGPPISFEYIYDKSMLIQFRDGGFLINDDSGTAFGFYPTIRSDEVNTLKEALDAKIIGTLEYHMKSGQRLVGDIEDVQRSIAGKLLKGKLIRISYERGDSDKKKVDTIEEIYIYKKDNRYVSLKFRTDPKSRELAERDFKIIADSIQ